MNNQQNNTRPAPQVYHNDKGQAVVAASGKVLGVSVISILRSLSSNFFFI